MIVNSRLRPGDTGTATEAVGFVRQSVARLPRAQSRTVLIRADRGLDAEALYAACEQRGWHYLVKLRVTPTSPAASGRAPPRAAGGGSTPTPRRPARSARSASAGNAGRAPGA